MKNHKNRWDIHEIHVTSWLIKDIFWVLKFKWLATFMVFPTILLAIYIILSERKQLDGNLTLFSWLLMNVSWMLHELQNLPYWPVQVFMFLGIFNTFRLIIKRRKDEDNFFRS
jgi:hypothetical protein